MKITETFIKDLYLIDYVSFKDRRGEFVKTIHASTYEKHDLEYIFDESFFSISNKNVIRGMHFQVPPEQHAKLVYLVQGKIIDVVLDLRKDSKTYGKYFKILLTDENRQGLYMSSGLAHGFLSLVDNSIVEYHTTTAHSAVFETGIRYDSFGFDWNVINPIVSDRDQNFVSFSSFKSPF